MTKGDKKRKVEIIRRIDLEIKMNAEGIRMKKTQE
jgi:hypothetical protein